jgi:hypothetical protein
MRVILKVSNPNPQKNQRKNHSDLKIMVLNFLKKSNNRRLFEGVEVT